MEPDGEEESGEMFSPNESGEYMPCDDMARFTVQGLRDALTVSRIYCNRTTVPQWMNTLFN